MQILVGCGISCLVCPGMGRLRQTSSWGAIFSLASLPSGVLLGEMHAGDRFCCQPQGPGSHCGSSSLDAGGLPEDGHGPGEQGWLEPKPVAPGEGLLELLLSMKTSVSLEPPFHGVFGGLLVAFPLPAWGDHFCVLENVIMSLASPWFPVD